VRKKSGLEDEWHWISDLPAVTGRWSVCNLD